MPEDTFDQTGDALRGFLQVLRRRWWVIVLCLIIAPLAAYGYARHQTKQYEATANVLVNDPSLSQQIAGTQGASASADQTSLLSTALSLASLDSVQNETAHALGPPYSIRGLPGSVAVANNGTSTILTVTATETTPSLAAHVANVYARRFIAFQTATALSQINQQRADIEGRLSALPTGQSASTVSFLKGRLAQLQTLGSLQNSELQVVAPATPPVSPSSPKVKRSVIAGVGLGLLLGILLAVLLSVLDPRLRNTTDVDAILDGPILGAIPRSRTLAKTWPNQGTPMNTMDAESFAMVYANLGHYNVDPVRSVLITSAAGGEGKSTVAWNLALAGARTGAKVLLIEADMRHPTIAKRIGAHPSGGLADVLSSEVSLADVVQLVRVNPEGDGGVTVSRNEFQGDKSRHRNGASRSSAEGDHEVLPAHDVAGHEHPELSVLLAGKLSNGNGGPPKNPMALLASERMSELIAAVENIYDLVVIDSPPASVVSDAIPLVKQVSGVLVVSRMRVNTRDGARHLRDQLENLRARNLGVVINGVDSVDHYYASNSGSRD